MFKAKNTGMTYSGELTYIRNENSFDFKPSKNSDITLMIGYIYLGIDSGTMLAQQIWGYSSKLSWGEKKLKIPTYFKGELLLEEEIEAGMSKRLVESGRWQTSYDKGTGWVCIGNECISQNEVAVEFAKNTIGVLDGGTLKSIWLRPTFC